MKVLRPLPYIVVMACSLLAVACSTSTKLTEQWNSPAYTKKLTSGRVMVTVATNHSDVRRQFEDELVARLKTAGVDAIPSYPYAEASGSFDRESVARVVQGTGADTVLALRPTGSQQESTPLGNAWLGVGAPSEAVQEAMKKQGSFTIYTADAQLIDVKERQVVWTGSLRTRFPGDFRPAADFASTYADKVVEALRDKKLV